MSKEIYATYTPLDELAAADMEAERCTHGYGFETPSCGQCIACFEEACEKWSMLKEYTFGRPKAGTFRYGQRALDECIWSWSKIADKAGESLVRKFGGELV